MMLFSTTCVCNKRSSFTPVNRCTTVTTCGATGVLFGTTVTRAGGAGTRRDGLRCCRSGEDVWTAAAGLAGVVDAVICDIAVTADATAIIVKVEMRNEIVLLMISGSA